ncbi:MAG: FKBP-type peptidyl-prolyl cis-trans isomerase [Chloroflexota bacterium]
MKLKTLILGTAVLLLLSACSPSTGGNDAVITTESGLQFEELEAGDGDTPQPGDIVAVHYTGTLEDGTEFDSSLTRGEPIEFPLGQGSVIPGWDEGIGMMQVGDKARLTIPPGLAYGEAGAGNVIPPNATLIFEVELVSIVPPPPTATPLPPPTSVDDGEFEEADSGLRFAVLQAGDGDMPESGGTVSFHFSGWLEDGTSIGTSYLGGQPLQITIGREEIMPGWDLALGQMQVGEMSQFIMPPELGLGEVGSPPVIPPNATLVFEFELLEILPPPPAPTSVDEEEFTTTDSGLQVAILEEGDGETPEAGQTVVVDYRGWLEDGFSFDNSYDRGQPFEFVLGQGNVIPGWDEGIALLQVGDKAQLVIPSDLGYGPTGSGSIPPDSVLIFEVELIEIR